MCEVNRENLLNEKNKSDEYTKIINFVLAGAYFDGK